MDDVSDLTVSIYKGKTQARSLHNVAEPACRRYDITETGNAVCEGSAVPTR